MQINIKSKKTEKSICNTIQYNQQPLENVNNWQQTTFIIILSKEDFEKFYSLSAEYGADEVSVRSKVVQISLQKACVYMLKKGLCNKK